MIVTETLSNRHRANPSTKLTYSQSGQTTEKASQYLNKESACGMTSMKGTSGDVLVIEKKLGDSDQRQRTLSHSQVDKNTATIKMFRRKEQADEAGTMEEDASVKRFA